MKVVRDFAPPRQTGQYSVTAALGETEACGAGRVQNVAQVVQTAP